LKFIDGGNAVSISTIEEYITKMEKTMAGGIVAIRVVKMLENSSVVY